MPPHTHTVAAAGPFAFKCHRSGVDGRDIHCLNALDFHPGITTVFATLGGGDAPVAFWNKQAGHCCGICVAYHSLCVYTRATQERKKLREFSKAETGCTGSMHATAGAWNPGQQLIYVSFFIIL